MNRFFRSALFPLIVIVLLVYLASQTLMKGEKQEKVTYSELQSEVASNPGQFEEIVANPSKQQLTVEYQPTGGNAKKIKVAYPSPESLVGFERLLKTEVNFDSKAVGGSPWWSLLTSLLPFVILIAFWIFLMNQVQGGGSKVMSFGKSRAKRMTPDSPKIGFKDVAGVDEAVEELHEIKEFLENPKKFQALGARIPKGVLLYGPPGTGKTLLARAVAGEAGSVLLHLWLRLRRDVRRRRRLARPRPLRAGEAGLAVHRLHGRDRRGRPPSRRRTRRRPRRARADAEPAPRRDGRVRAEGQHHPDRGHEPARHPGPSSAPPPAFRPADRRRPTGPGRPEEDPRGT